MSAVHLNSNVRRYAPYGPLHWMRRAWTLRFLGARGADVWVDRNVQVQRHPERVRLGERVMLKEGVRLVPTNPAGEIIVGDWTTLGHHTFIFAASSVRIGNHCLIAPFCYFVDSNHGVERGALIRSQPMTAKPIVVGDDVWLGTGAKIMPGVRIGDGAVVAAGAVVVDDVPAQAIVGGVPARIISERKPPPQ